MKVNIADVVSVYSGKAFRCTCGCSGKHYYSSVHQEYAGAERGYPVRPEEVNDGMVARITNKINANIRDVKVLEGSVFVLESDTRLNIVAITTD